MKIIILFLFVFLMGCGDDEVIDHGVVHASDCINCKKTGAPKNDGADQVNNPSGEGASELDKCKRPLKIETINCSKNSEVHAGVFSYIQGVHIEEKKLDCIKKYFFRMQGCTNKFTAKWPGSSLPSLCVSSQPTCDSAKTAWKNEMSRLGYECSSASESIEKSQGEIPTSISDCSETNSFEPFY